jgi:hypothetical protein
MSQLFVWPSIAAYGFFCIFVAQLQRHALHNQGPVRQWWVTFMSRSALLGLVVGLSYLAYYGNKTTWATAGIILVLGFIISLLSFFIEYLTHPRYFSWVAVAGWPIFAYFMFLYAFQAFA